MKTRMIGIVFFCTMGSVYSGWAIGAEPATSNAGATSATTPLFDNAAAKPAGLETGAVKVGSFGQIDLHVKDQDLTRILQLLSIQAQRNIIVSKNVTGSVTADLYGVDFYQAMDALLHANGYGYREKGNFIYVYTTGELKQIQDAERKTTAKVVRLNYISAADASAFVTPLLSSAGAITLSGNVGAGYVATTSDGGANSFAHADTLIIRDYPENLEEIAKVLGQLDVRPKQVLVEATVLEAKLTEKNAFGVNMTILADFGFSDFPSGAQGAANTISNMVGGKIAGNAQAVQWNNVVNTEEQSFRVGILNNNISAFVDALDKVTDTTVLANPKLLVLNRQRASLLVGERKGYISTTQTETSTTQTVQFLELGTQLALRPFVSDDGMIRLEIQPSISTGEVVQVGTTNVTVPNEDTQRLTTNVMVRSGQTVVLGGLFKESTTITRKQVPGVGDIPLLGAAFKGQSDSLERNEFIFLLTPTVVKDEAIYAAGDRAKDSAELARIGARSGLLPWSRSKMVNAHMRDALGYYEKGNKDKALWAANMALTLDPSFTEARRLQEQITGQRLQTSYDSMFQDAIDTMVKKQMELDKAVPAPTKPTENPKASEAPVAPKAEAPGSAPAPAPGSATGNVSTTPAAVEVPVTPAVPTATPAPTAEVKAVEPAAAVTAPSMQDMQNAGRADRPEQPGETATMQPAADEAAPQPAPEK